MQKRRHVASRKRSYHKHCPCRSLAQLRGGVVHVRDLIGRTNCHCCTLSYVTRQVKAKEAWPLCYECPGSSQEGFASMLPLQSVSVTTRLFMDACCRAVIDIKVVPLRLPLTRKLHFPPCSSVFRCAAAAASVKIRVRGDNHDNLII